MHRHKLQAVHTRKKNVALTELIGTPLPQPDLERDPILVAKLCRQGLVSGERLACLHKTREVAGSQQTMQGLGRQETA